MDQFDDELYDIDEFDDNGGAGDNPPTNDGGDPGSSDDTDLTADLLRMKGIKDTSKIKFADESGAIVERDWNTLSRNEQLAILSDQEAEDTALDQDEVSLINAIRNSGMSVNGYMQRAVTAAQPTAQPSYRINELSDDEVFALDLLDKVGSDNISDDEIDEALANAKQNPNLFKKTVDGLRSEYMRLQKDEEAREANNLAAQKRAAYNQFASAVGREIQGFNSFGGQDLELSPEDQEELAAFVLNLDDHGMSAFGRAITRPDMLTKAAFWLLNEQKITEELTKQMQNTYKRGYEQAKRDLSSTVVTRKSRKSPDTFVDDDEW